MPDEIPPDIYRVTFLREHESGRRYLALPSHPREDDYEIRLEEFVRTNYPDIIVFSQRHNAELDFETSSSLCTSAILLRIRDEDTLALLRLGFEGKLCQIGNHAEIVAMARAMYDLKKKELQKKEFESVKARYFELKKIIEAEDDQI